jgi:glycosyltransferase involved in cell wall biosynthesis
MRLLHVVAGKLFGGIETVLVTLARHGDTSPSPLEHRFAVCFDGRLRERLEAAGASPVRLGAVRLSRPWQVLRARRALGRAVRALRPDFVVFHDPWGLATLAAGVPRGQAATVLWAHAPFTGEHWLERLARRRLPARIVANSEFTAHGTRRALPGAHVDVVRCPVSPPPGGWDPARIPAIRASLGVAADAFLVAMVGRPEPLKGHALLVRALERLRGDPRWACAVAGGPQSPAEAAHFEAVRRLVAGAGLSGRVRLLGFREDVADIVRSADVLCQPNVAPDSLGLSVVEALQCGVPVVATAMGGPAEIVTPACGALVAPEAAALADALRALMDDPARVREMRAAAPARAAALCSPEAQVRALEAVLRSGGAPQEGRAA